MPNGSSSSPSGDASGQTQPPPAPNTAQNSNANGDTDHHYRAMSDDGSAMSSPNNYNSEFAQRESARNVRREVENIDGPRSNFHQDEDGDMNLFEEPPHLRVVDARSEEAWPTRYVEYDVEVSYRSYKWKVEISKSALYGLWFYIKSRYKIRHGKSNARQMLHHAHSSDYAITSDDDLPGMRKFFLASADASTSSEMVMLVQSYLEKVVQMPGLLSSSYVVSLFQVSNSTFDDEDGVTSIREGWMKVRSWLKGNKENVQVNRGAVSCDNECFNCTCVVKRVHLKPKRTRWVALKFSSIAVYDSIADTEPMEVMLFDNSLEVKRGMKEVGSKSMLVLSNATYVMQLEAKTKQAIVKWANAIRDASSKSAWVQSHRDDSYSITRNPTEVPSYARWFADGSGTYEAIYDEISAAKKEVFIAGWWVCPTIYLKRPPEKYPESRLDQLLQKKAEEGVQVYVLMYKEIAMALTLNSYFSKMVLQRLHPNVHVLRDPDFIVKNLGMYSHHEKIVVCDQKIGFVGGLDICFGRWDTGKHALFDEPGDDKVFVGKDYSNPRVKDFIELNQPEKDMIDRETVPRMPWHDVHCRLEGQPARDVARHFIQRWNYSVSTRKKTESQHHLVPRKDYERTRDPSRNPQDMLNNRLQNAMRAARVIQGFQGSKNASKDRSEVSHADLHARLQKEQTQNGGEEKTEENNGKKSKWGKVANVFKRKPQPMRGASANHDGETEDYSVEDEALKKKRGVAVSTQILRSVTWWSAGTSTEHSIQNAYIRLIGSAKHFVYIENQFFISGLEGDNGVSNRIANALVERIKRAAANDEQFRVMVMMPLMPAFPGEPEDSDAASLRGVMYWQYRSICRGENSIYATLFKELDVDPFEYIAFFGLRNYTVRNDKPETEEIYIHSKLMIVDDQHVIIGSANINERSQNGDRDSEIAVVVDDHEMADARIADGKAQVGKFAHSFRMRLFAEHFGVDPGTDLYQKYTDPVDKETWLSLQDHAMSNCQIYESVFACLPSDRVLSFDQIATEVDPENEVKHTEIADNAEEPQQGSGQVTGNARQEDGFGGPTEEVGRHPAASEPIEGGEVLTENSEMKGVPQEERRGKNKGGEKRPSMTQKMDSLNNAMMHHLRDNEKISEKQEELSNIRGHVVYFPLKFLAEENLEPPLYPAELFQ